MPIYEYKCASCHAQTEHLQKISDPVLTTCPECQQESLVRLVSGAGFQLKGTGWYVTDFKNKTTPKAEPKKDTES
jgi:putative FmdB family regulatory protein